VLSDYVWWDIVMDLLHAHKSHKPLGAQDLKVGGGDKMTSLAFLDVTRPAVKLIWTKVSILKELKKNLHAYTARLNAAMVQAPVKFLAEGMTKYWNEEGTE
jgi:hypothetical protein